MKIKCTIARGMLNSERAVRVNLPGDGFACALVDELKVDPPGLPDYGVLIDGTVEVMEVSADKGTFLVEFFGQGVATGARFRCPKELVVEI